MFHSISITRADSPLSKICIWLEEITAVCSFHMLLQTHTHTELHGMPPSMCPQTQSLGKVVLSDVFSVFDFIVSISFKSSFLLIQLWAFWKTEGQYIMMLSCLFSELIILSMFCCDKIPNKYPKYFRIRTANIALYLKDINMVFEDHEGKETRT